MDVSSSADELWKYKAPVAELRTGSLSAHVDLSHPELGASGISLGAHRLNGNLLCVRRSDEAIGGPGQDAAAWPVADAYVRGPDLVVTYQATDDWPFAPQIYWEAGRSDVAGPLGALSLLVSVQTHLLETWPRISIESHLQPEEVLLLEYKSTGEIAERPLTYGDHVFQPTTATQCIVQRLAGGQLSYVEVMPASDYRELGVRRGPDGACHTNWLLFGDFLEKGVIWRARLQSLFVPRAEDVRLAVECCREIDKRPLPLTA